MDLSTAIVGMAGVVVIMPGSPGPRVVTVNDLLDGQVVLDIECLDRNSRIQYSPAVDARIEYGVVQGDLRP